MSVYEKFIYKNENNEQIEFSALSDFFLVKISGIAGLNNIINSAKSTTDGSFYIDSSISSRNIIIQGKLKKSNRDYNRSKLIRILNPKLKGKLYYENTQTNTFRYIDCILEKSPDPVKDFSSTFQISLICTNPFWKDVSENKKSIASWIGDFHFPLTIINNITMGHREPSLIANVKNTGDINIGMIIEFIAIGTLKNPSLFDINTRKFLKIKKTMLPGEKIIINTNFGEKKIESYFNGVTQNILNYIDIQGGGCSFLQLAVGDNLLRYDADENVNNLEVNLYFTPCYLGV